MTKQQTEQLLLLTSRQEWAAFLAYKQERLDKLHKDLEWEEQNIKKVQGQIAEIKADLRLQDSLLASLENA